MCTFRSFSGFLLVLSVFLISACSSGGGSSPAAPTTAYTVTDAATGVTVSVPAGAYDTSVAQPKITISKTTTLPSGAVLPAGATQGNVYTLTKDYADSFLQPVDVTVPYDPATIDLPTVLYWDTTNSKYVMAAIKNIDSAAKTVTFSTVHFSSFIVMKDATYNGGTTSLPSVDTSFVPTADGFFHPNFGSFAEPAGCAFGMSNFSIWYYVNKKSGDSSNLYNNTKGLYNKYREGDPQLYSDDVTAKALIASTQNAVAGIWKNEWTQSKYKLTDKQTGLLLLAAMKLINSPQILFMKALDSNGADLSAHAVVVTKFTPDSSGTAGIFTLYDPNFPGENVTISWSLTGGFSSYSKQAAYSYTFTKFALDGLTAFADSAQFEKAYQAAETTVLGTIAISSPTLDANSAAAITLTSSTIPSVTVSGTITPATGKAAPTYLIYSVNAGTPVTVSLSGSSFSFTLSGLKNTNTVMLAATSNLKNPWDNAAFKQFTISFVGTAVTSFTNMGFENYSTGWTVETHLWSDATRDTTGSPFATVSSTPDPNVKMSCGGNTYGGCVDYYGMYFSPTGTANTNYNPKWGSVTSYTPGTFSPGKSSTVAQGTDDIFQQYLTGLGGMPNTSGLSSFNMVYNGTRAMRVNNYDDSYHASSVKQTATIPSAANPTINFAWAAVLEDPQHDFPNQPFVEVLVKDETANKELYRKHFFSGDPSYSGWVVLNSSSFYSPWNVIPWQKVSLDVTSAIGHSVTIRVYASDCGYGGHGGYAYLDDAQ